MWTYSISQDIPTTRETYQNTLYWFWNRIIIIFFYAESQQVYVTIQFSVLIISCFHFYQATENQAYRGILFPPVLRESLVLQTNSCRNSIQLVNLYHSPAFLKMVNLLAFTGDSDMLMDKRERGERVPLLPGVLIYVLQRNRINQMCVYIDREMERKTYFKDLAHVIVGVGKSKIYTQNSN